MFTAQAYCPSWGWVMFRLFSTATGGWVTKSSLLRLIAPLGRWVMSKLFATVTGGKVAVQAYYPFLGMGNDPAFCYCYRGMGNCVQAYGSSWGWVIFRLFATVTGGWVTVQAYCPSWGWTMFRHFASRMGNCSGLLLSWGWVMFRLFATVTGGG
jgi:hypothetical protein